MINRKNLSDYSSLKKPNKDEEIVREYTSIKLKTEPTELQNYYEYLTKSQSILDEVNYVADRMKREDLRTLREEYRFLEELKAEREKELLKEKKREEEVKKLIDDITPTIQTPLELEEKTFSTDLSAKMDEESQFEKRINLFKEAVKEREAKKETKKEQKKAVSVLEAAIKGQQIRSKFDDFKKIEEATKVVQGAIRKKQEREKFEKAKKGITEFQGVVRGQQERKKYDVMLEDISQATTAADIETLKKIRKQRSDKGVKRGSYRKK